MGVAEGGGMARAQESDRFPATTGFGTDEKVGHLFRQSPAGEVVDVIRGQASTDRLMSPIPCVSRARQ